MFFQKFHCRPTQSLVLSQITTDLIKRIMAQARVRKTFMLVDESTIGSFRS